MVRSIVAVKYSHSFESWTKSIKLGLDYREGLAGGQPLLWFGFSKLENENTHNNSEVRGSKSFERTNK